MLLNGKDYDRGGLARLAGDLSAAGGVRSVVLDNGVERGIRALEFRTGSGLAFDVLVDRAMDIGPAEFAGRSFGWRSATGNQGQCQIRQVGGRADERAALHSTNTEVVSDASTVD